MDALPESALPASLLSALVHPRPKTVGGLAVLFRQVQGRLTEQVDGKPYTFADVICWHLEALAMRELQGEL